VTGSSSPSSPLHHTTPRTTATPTMMLALVRAPRWQITMQWRDSRLRMPDGLSRVQLQDGQVWTPQIDFYNDIGGIRLPATKVIDRGQSSDIWHHLASWPPCLLTVYPDALGTRPTSSSPSHHRSAPRITKALHFHCAHGCHSSLRLPQVSLLGPTGSALVTQTLRFIGQFAMRLSLLYCAPTSAHLPICPPAHLPIYPSARLHIRTPVSYIFRWRHLLRGQGRAASTHSHWRSRSLETQRTPSTLTIRRQGSPSDHLTI